MKKYIYLTIGMFVLLPGAASPNFGLQPSSDEYSIGYNIGVLTYYVMGVAFLIQFFRENRKSKKKSKGI